MLVGPNGNNFYEVMFTAAILFTTVGIFAYLINEIGAIFKDINESEEIYNHSKLSVSICELRNLRSVAYLVTKAAKNRTKNIGLHFNIDSSKK